MCAPLLQEHPDWYVVATDCRNAYNSVSRGGVLRAMQEFDPALLPFVRFFYDEPARLRYAAAAGVARLLSRSGVQQGDPLASVLFSVAIQPALLEIQATAVGDAAGAVVVAQIDDVYGWFCGYGYPGYERNRPNASSGDTPPT